MFGPILRNSCWINPSHGETRGHPGAGFSAAPGGCTVESSARPVEGRMLVGGVEHEFYDFPYIGNNHPNWLWNHQPECLVSCSFSSWFGWQFQLFGTFHPRNMTYMEWGILVNQQSAMETPRNLRLDLWKHGGSEKDRTVNHPKNSRVQSRSLLLDSHIRSY